MLNRITTTLLCIAAPVTLHAQEVELRSADGLFSVEGEIIGFNGTMLSVETSVGVVNVPAADVSCIGNGCLAAITNEAYGLRAESFAQVLLGTGPAPVATPTSDATSPAAGSDELRSDALSISFGDERYEAAFRALADSFAVAEDTTSQITFDTPDEMELSNTERNELATLRFSRDSNGGDVSVDIDTFYGSADFVYQGPADWALVGPFADELLALGAFAVIAADDIGVSEISIDDLAAIYAGELTNWSELGGADQRILPLQLPQGTKSHVEMQAVVMTPVDKTIASNILTLETEERIVQSVGQFPGSIGVIDVGSVGDLTALPVTGACDVPVSPDSFAVASGDYPLLRPVVAQFDQSTNTGLVNEMLNFATDPSASDVIVAEGFIGLQPFNQTTDESSNRVGRILGADLSDAQKSAGAAMFELLFAADRLSTTIIGGAVSGPEGAWNRAAFTALARTLAGPEYAGREVFFVGLATSSNGSDAAVSTSARVASETQATFGQFAADVISTNNLQLSSHGFGDVAQQTCYESQVAAETYSQVEIWVR